MPTQTPSVSYQQIRNYAERFDWIDRRSGEPQTGHNPPADALKVVRHPFFVRYISGEGKVAEGMVTCIHVDARRRMRRIRYVSSGEVRWVRDALIIAIDGTHFVTH